MAHKGHRHSKSTTVQTTLDTRSNVRIKQNVMQIMDKHGPIACTRTCRQHCIPVRGTLLHVAWTAKLRNIAKFRAARRTRFGYGHDGRMKGIRKNRNGERRWRKTDESETPTQNDLNRKTTSWPKLLAIEIREDWNGSEYNNRAAYHVFTVLESRPASVRWEKQWKMHVIKRTDTP